MVHYVFEVVEYLSDLRLEEGLLMLSYHRKYLPEVLPEGGGGVGGGASFGHLPLPLPRQLLRPRVLCLQAPFRHGQLCFLPRQHSAKTRDDFP